MLWFKLYTKYSEFTWWSYVAHLPLRVIHFLFLQHTKLDPTLVICPHPAWNMLPVVDSFWSQGKYYCLQRLSNLSIRSALRPLCRIHNSALLIWNDHIQKAKALSATTFTTLPTRPVIKPDTYQPPRYLVGEWIHKYLP